MTTRNVFTRWCVLCGAALMLAACSRLAWWRDKPSGAETAPAEETAAVEVEREGHEAALRRVVGNRITSAPTTPGNHYGKLIRRKPYFYKEYVVYPEGADSFELLITETESRTAPYIANVKLRKLRFATRFHPKKEDARNDDSYLRDTGAETLTYEYRNGKWTLLGSFFRVEKTEENINDEWVPLEKEVLRTVVSEEERKGWFGRAWSRLSGRK